MVQNGERSARRQKCSSARRKELTPRGPSCGLEERWAWCEGLAVSGEGAMVGASGAAGRRGRAGAAFRLPALGLRCCGSFAGSGALSSVEAGRRARALAGAIGVNVKERDGTDIRALHELLGHADVSTAMSDTHVLDRGPPAGRSPLDRVQLRESAGAGYAGLPNAPVVPWDAGDEEWVNHGPDRGAGA